MTSRAFTLQRRGGHHQAGSGFNEISISRGRERTQKAAPRVADPGEVAGSGHGAGAAVEAVGKAWGPSYSVSTAAQGP